MAGPGRQAGQTGGCWVGKAAGGTAIHFGQCALPCILGRACARLQLGVGLRSLEVKFGLRSPEVTKLTR